MQAGTGKGEPEGGKQCDQRRLKRVEWHLAMKRICLTQLPEPRLALTCTLSGPTLRLQGKHCLCLGNGISRTALQLQLLVMKSSSIAKTTFE